MRIRVLGNRESPRSQVLTRTFELDDSLLEERIIELELEEYEMVPINPETGKEIPVRGSVVASTGAGGVR